MDAKAEYITPFSEAYTVWWSKEPQTSRVAPKSRVTILSPGFKQARTRFGAETSAQLHVGSNVSNDIMITRITTTKQRS
jgi:hypothetical protein